jgi:hypothetical protein
VALSLLNVQITVATRAQITQFKLQPIAEGEVQMFSPSGYMVAHFATPAPTKTSAVQRNRIAKSNRSTARRFKAITGGVVSEQRPR